MDDGIAKNDIDKELTSIYSELKELFIYTDLIRYPYPKAMDRLSDLILEIRKSKKNES